MRFDSNVSLKLKDAYHARHEPEAERFLGRVYWAFLIILLALTICGSLGFGVWEFIKPIAVIPEDAVNTRARKVLTKMDLQKILQAFDERAEEYESRKTAPLPVKDPS